MPDNALPGRPKGLPKTGGRKKGVPNRTTVESREYIKKRADPVEFLCKVALGHQVEAALELGKREKALVRPTLEQRIDAAKVLARKILPDMREVEHTGGAFQEKIREMIEGLDSRAVEAPMVDITPEPVEARERENGGPPPSDPPPAVAVGVPFSLAGKNLKKFHEPR